MKIIRVINASPAIMVGIKEKPSVKEITQFALDNIESIYKQITILKEVTKGLYVKGGELNRD